MTQTIPLSEYYTPQARGVVSAANSPLVRKKRVGIDMDGVVSNLTERFVFYANLMYGVPLGTEPLDWDWAGLGLTKEQTDKVWRAMLDTPNFWLTLFPLPGIRGSMQLARLTKNTDVFFLTSTIDTPGMSPYEQRVLWLERTGVVDGVASWEVVIAKDKGPAAVRLGLDFFLDDYPKNCYDVDKHLPSCRVYLMDASHNKACRDFPRIRNLSEFAAIVLGGQTIQ